MVFKNVTKIVIAAGEALGKALVKAVKQEHQMFKMNAQNRAAASGASTSSSTSQSSIRNEARTNARLGITLQESMQILNIKEINKEEIEKRFQHLFEINDRKNGGNLYLQSKVYRAKERLDAEMDDQIEKEEANEEPSPSEEKPSEPKSN